MHHIMLSLADGAAGAGGAPGGAPAGCAGGGMTQMIPLLLMFVIFYFMLIRPQQKKAREHQTFLGGLKKGDQVITRGGVIGRITGVTDNVITLEIQEKVRVRVLKGYIEGAHKDGAAASPSDKGDKGDKSDKSDKKEKDAGTPAA